MIATSEVYKKQIKHFTDLLVWQKAHRLFVDVLGDMAQLPRSTVSRVLTDQIVRSIGSISANISEGFLARSTKEYIHYLDIARRTTGESENWFYKLRDARLIDTKTAELRIQTCVEVSKMLQRMIKALGKFLK